MALVAGCGWPGLAWPVLARAEVTLLFWPGPESEAMQKVIDAWNAGPGKAPDDQVKQLLFSRQGYFDKEIADLAAGSKEFDVALVTTYTLGRYAPFLDPIGQDLSPDVKTLFAPVALGSLALNGEQYGVPTDISLHFTYYRKDLIDRLLTDDAWKKSYAAIAQKELGKALEPKDPKDWTWDDFMATALFFTKRINPDSPTRYGTVLELKNLIFNIMIWQAALVSNGGNWLDQDGKVIIDSPAARRALEIYKKLIDAGATPPDSTNYEYAEANAAFGSGQVATMLQWNAAFNELNDAKKESGGGGEVLGGADAGRARRPQDPHPQPRHRPQQGLDPQGGRRPFSGVSRQQGGHGDLRESRRHAARPVGPGGAEGLPPRIPARRRVCGQIRLRHPRRHQRRGGARSTRSWPRTSPATGPASSPSTRPSPTPPRR